MCLMCLLILLTIAFIVVFYIFVTTTSFFVLEKDQSFNPKSYSLESDGSLQVYFINLDKSKKRLEYITPQLQALGYNFERIPGIYGADIPEDELERITAYERLNREFKDSGTVGCYLSHMKAWRSFLESSHKYALICEDDIEFDPEELRQIIDGILQAKSKWDIVNLEIGHRGHPSLVESLPGTKCGLYKYRTRVSHMGCYLINRNAAIKLLSKALPALMDVDQYFSRSWELGTIFRGVEPRIVHQKFGDSEIANQKSAPKERSLRIKINGWVFSLKTDAAFFVHSLFF